MEFMEYLVSKGIISTEESQNASVIADRYSIKALEALFAKNDSNKDAILKAYAEFYRVDYSESIDINNVSDILPAAFLRERHIVPIEVKKGSIELGMSNPFDMNTIKDIEFITGMDVHVHLVSYRQINDILNSKLPANEIEVDNIEDETIEILSDPSDKDREGMLDLKNLAYQPPIIRLVNIIFIEAIRKGVTDIHIEPQKDMLVVRFRLDGHLQTYAKLSLKLLSSIVSRIKVIAEMNIAERRKPQDGSISIIVEEKEVDLRVNTIPSLYGEKCVIRLLDKSKFDIGLENLGYDEKAVSTLEHMTARPYGIIFVCGPTGSGKTTTLYSLLKKIQSPDKNIITVEDPVEYKLEGITQVQVNEKGGVTFPSALKAILRQDPDVILIGEIRDKETAQIAVQAALTGHLVLSTIHTNDALSVFSRLTSMGVSPNLISDSVIGIIAQRLVRKVCPFCGEVSSVPADTINKTGIISEGFEQMHAEGCPKCSNTGYNGRTVVYEMVDVDNGLKEMILEEKSKQAMFAHITDKGFPPMSVTALEKVLKCVTTLEEISGVTDLSGLRVENDRIIWPPSAEPGKNTVSNGKRKILVVDDSKTIRMMLKPILESEGFKVEEAEDGYACLQYLKEQPADLIIMDLMMPRMNGFETLKTIRSTEGISNIPIIMLTTKSELENELKGFDLGVDEFLPKPIMPDKLLARVKRISMRINANVG